MKRTRFLISAILIICLLVNLSLPVSAAGINDIIKNLLIYYSHHQENARTDILRLLEEMRTIDPEQAENWAQIMDCWHWVCTEQEITPDVLPDGLPEDDSLCIVVMGFALNYNGSIREELQGRLQATLASAEKYPNAYILCTGGGTAGGNPNVTEAEQMAAWLENQGVDPARIIVENRSYSTELNAEYSMKILRESYPQVTSLALVSSDYHLRRCHLLFQTVICLSDLEERYTILASAGYQAGYIGESGFMAEAESIGNLFGLYVRNTKVPTLAKLTEIRVEGNTEYPLGATPDLTVTACYDKEITRDVTALAEISGFDPDTPGDQEITVSYTENGITSSVSILLTVLEPPTETTVPPTEAPTEPTPTESNATEPIAEPEPDQPANFPLWIPCAGGAVLVIIAMLLIPKRRKGKYERRG